jgi:predicted metalloendopeptidase
MPGGEVGRSSAELGDHGDGHARSRRRHDPTNPSHAPAEYRADTVRNLDAWYEAFGVKPGQALYLPPAERVRVW